MAEPERILVVDDEAGICRAVIRILKAETRVVDAMVTAEDALLRVANNAYDLYILDKNLPGMSGIELAATIRAADRAAGILILTGYASRESALEALHVGVDGYVEKPVIRSALLERADEALTASHRRRRLSRRLHTARAAQDALEQRDRAGRARVLSAYTDVAYGERLTAALRRAGHTAECVTSPDEVIAGLKASSLPDVLIADAVLALNLTTTLKDAVAQRPQLAIIVTGTAPSFQQVQALIASGAKAVVERPLAGEHLSNELSRLLGGGSG